MTRPTKFHKEFSDAFGKPVYEGLRALLSRKVKGAEELDLWCSSVWAQVSVYALSDVQWHKAFRPRGAKARAWAKRVSDHICGQVFLSLDSQKEVR